MFSAILEIKYSLINYKNQQEIYPFWLSYNKTKIKIGFIIISGN